MKNIDLSKIKKVYPVKSRNTGLPLAEFNRAHFVGIGGIGVSAVISYFPVF